MSKLIYGVIELVEKGVENSGPYQKVKKRTNDLPPYPDGGYEDEELCTEPFLQSSPIGHSYQ